MTVSIRGIVPVTYVSLTVGILCKSVDYALQHRYLATLQQYCHHRERLTVV